MINPRNIFLKMQLFQNNCFREPRGQYLKESLENVSDCISERFSVMISGGNYVVIHYFY